MKKNGLLFIVIFFASACAAYTQQSSLPENEFSFQSEAIVQSIANTPYSALIRLISVEVIDLPDPDESDGFAEQKFIYTADVLETYRGEKTDRIFYIMRVEKGETPDFPGAPFIITLCKSKEGFYWPGVGASFSADNRLRALAKEAAKKADRQPRDFGDCE